MNPTDDQDFIQFEGAFDYSQAPDPTFAEALSRRMATEQREAPTLPTVTLTSPPANALRVQKPADLPPTSRRPVWVAVAALLVVAIIGASVWKVSGLVDEGQYGAVPEVVLPVDASVIPGPDVTVTSRAVPETDGLFLFDSTDDAVLLMAIPPTDAGPNMVAMDSQGKERLWEMNGSNLRQVITHGSTRYALEVGEGLSEYDVPSTDLVAYDADSGTQVWATELPIANKMSYWGSMAVSDDLVVVTGTQTVVAIDASTGVEIWQRQLSDVGINRYSEMSLLDPVIVNGRIALIEESGTLRVLDSASGESVKETAVFDVAGANVVSYARAFASPHGLLTMIVYSEGGQSYTDLALLDDSLSSTAWTRQVKGFGTIDVSDNGDIAIVTSIFKSYPGFLKIVGLRSHTNSNLIWIDGSTGGDILTTKSTSTEDWGVMSVTTNGTYACFIAYDATCVDRHGAMYFIDIVLDNRLAIYTDTYIILAGNTLWIQREQGVEVFDLP